MEPIRRAILIGSQSRGSKYLPGVKKDLAALKRYLKSPNGGAWREQEIIVLENPTVSNVLSVISQTIGDYLYVYFSGHGITRYGNRRMVALSDGELQDVQLLNQSPRQTVMIDACGTLDERAAIGGLRRVWPEEKYQYFTGYSAARAYFDQCISESPFGKLIVHATQIGQSAIDTPNGGKFTNALLDSVLMHQRSQQNGELSVSSVVQHASRLLQKEGLNQFPVIYKQGYLNVPFGITSSEFIYPTEGRRNTTVNQSNDAAVGGLLLFTTILLTAYALSR